jgi:oxygen-independent coproporphyrinogen-3 oxidase
MVQARLDGPPLEFTCEANPESLTQEHVAAMREFGVHRVSLGAQSFQTDVLAALGREHAPKHTYRAVELLRSAGLENLSLDLIYATPGETRQQVQADLEVLVKLQVPHVSAYCLTYEPGTPLTRLLDQGRVEKSDSEEELFQGRLVRDTLQSHGLVQYEISNYARPGLESLHNNVYWRGEEYFGIGLGAGSYEHGVRRTNTRNQEEYLAPWADPQRPPHLAEELDPEARAREVVILGLRRTRGLDLDRLARQTGFALFDLYSEELLDKLLHLNVLLLDAGNLRLTPRGLELADSIFVDLV